MGYINPRSFARAFQDVYAMIATRFRAAGQVRAANFMNNAESKMFDVTLETRAPLRIAPLTHKGAYPDIGHTFQKLVTVLSEGGHWAQTRGMMAVHYDDPTSVAPEDLTSHARTIWAGAAVPEGLEDVSLTGGRRRSRSVPTPRMTRHRRIC